MSENRFTPPEAYQPAAAGEIPSGPEPNVETQQPSLELAGAPVAEDSESKPELGERQPLVDQEQRAHAEKSSSWLKTLQQKAGKAAMALSVAVMLLMPAAPSPAMAAPSSRAHETVQQQKGPQIEASRETDEARTWARQSHVEFTYAKNAKGEDIVKISGWYRKEGETSYIGDQDFTVRAGTVQIREIFGADHQPTGLKIEIYDGRAGPKADDPGATFHMENGWTGPMLILDEAQTGTK